MSRIFLQPEFGWNHYRRTCSFSLPNENSESSYSPSIDLNIHSKTGNANFLVGYNIINDYPFLLGAFAGVSFTGTYRTDYSMESSQSFSKTDLALNYSGIIGLSINISRIYFDLRYEMRLPDDYLYLKDIPDFPDFYQNVKIKKNEAILSFSCGVMF
jgi:hypothetical protein